MKEVFKYFFVRFERNILTGLEREGQIILEGSCLAVGADGSGSYGTGGALAATFGYDSYGLPSSTVTGSVQHYSYSFDPVKGNLLSRKNEKNGMQEGFSYDSLDRLTWVSRGSSPFHNTVYDDNGNITSKSDAGTLSYENSNRPFQVTKLVSNNTSYGANQTVSYNSFEKVSSIGEGSYGATFVYDSAGERVKMNVTQNGASILARTYIGSRYIREVQNGVTKEYTFIGGDGYSAPAVIMQQGGVKTRYYLLRDHLGSVTHVVDNSGSVLNEYSFDAWGRQRNVSTWIHYAADTEPALFMGRGYTGHEHLPWFNLVNMNGRLYDPVVGRFLSPDPFVQSPEFSQNFNRYSYCLNNPLIYVDKDGEWFWIPVAIGGIINTINHWDEIKDANNFWEGLGKGVGIFVAGGANGYLTAFGRPLGTFVGGFIEEFGSNLITGNTEDLLKRSLVSGGTQYIGGKIANKVSNLANKGLTNLGLKNKLVKNVLSDVAGAIPGTFTSTTTKSYFGYGKSFKESLKDGMKSVPEAVLSGIGTGITKTLMVEKRAAQIEKIRQNPDIIDPYYDFQWKPSNNQFLPLIPEVPIYTPSTSPSLDLWKFVYPELYYPWKN